MENIKFRNVFHTESSEMKHHIGKQFSVIEKICDEDEENDRMYLIRLEDGDYIEAFDYEIEVWQ